VHFDPPNDHKDYLHRSGRTARAGASGMVVSLVDHSQARIVSRMHDAAGVTASRDNVQVGHDVVREIAESGTPVPPAPPTPPPSARAAQGAPGKSPRGPRSGSGRPPRRGDQSRSGDPGRRSEQSRRGGPGASRPASYRSANS
jgi:superfamily II DNA/RNA helicase